MSQVTYQIDPAHTSAHFSIRHLMISNVRGEFGKVSGTVIYDADNPANSKADASIEVGSLNTREPQRDAHLKSADFFDVEKFPLIAFHSKEVSAHGGEWKVKAAGPTTSIREEPYQADVIRRYGVRAVIGKGGMGKKTLDALQECGAVYLNGIGGGMIADLIEGWLVG